MSTDTILTKPGEGRVVRKTFPVTGMTCAGCATSVESMLKTSEGVADAGVNFANQTAWAEYDEEKTNPSELQKAIRSIGYDIIVNVENPPEVQEELQLKHYQETRHKTIWASVLSFPVFIIGMFFMDLLPDRQACLTEPGYLWFSPHRCYFGLGVVSLLMPGNRLSMEKPIWIPLWH